MKWNSLPPLAIDWIVVKNAGGDASRTKLTRARRLGIPF